MKDYLNFYYCVQLFLDRMGYMSHIDPGGIKAETEEESKARNWVKWGVKAIELFFNVDVPITSKPFFIALDNLSPEQIDNLKRDWENFRNNFPVAGLHFSQGRPCVFCARIGDFQFPTTESLSLYYKNLDQTFMKFSSKHTLAISNYSQSHLIFCLGFKDNESANVAKAFLKQGGSNLHIFKQAWVETWLFDLNSFEIVMPKGILFTFQKSLEDIVKKVKTVVGHKQISTLKDWPFSNCPVIDNQTFIDFFKFFVSDAQKGDLIVPGEWKEYLKDETLKLEKLSFEAQINKIKKEIEEYELLLGKSVFARYEAGIPFKSLEESLKKTSYKVKTINVNKQKVQSIVSLREKWVNSQNRKANLNLKKEANDKQFKSTCYQLAESMFKYERKKIESDSKLKRAFIEPLQLQGQIENREKEIREKEKIKSGFLESIKINARILYLKGINQKDQWKQNNSWYQTGLRVIDIGPEFSQSSLVTPIWINLNTLKLQIEDLFKKIQQEDQIQAGLLNEIKYLSNGNCNEQFPWMNFQDSLNTEIRSFEEELPKLYLLIGKNYRSSGEKAKDELLEIEKNINNLEYQRKEIIQELQKIYEKY